MRLRKNPLMVFVLSLVMSVALFCGVFVFYAQADVKTDNAVLKDAQIAQQYKIGDELIIPDIPFVYNGRDYPTTNVLVMPDGSTVQKSSIVFEKSGKYSLLYKSLINGKFVEEAIDFVVLNNLYTVHNNKSSVVWETNPYLDSTMKGINLSLRAGDTFTFNKVIDLSKMTKEDLICKFYITPAAKGSPEMEDMYIKLTDIYNPDNYVLVNYSMVLDGVTWSYKYVYANAGASGQDMIGLEYSYNADGVLSSTQHVNSDYGLRSSVTYTGVNPPIPSEVKNNAELAAKLTTFEENYDYLSMDYQNRQVYVKSQHYFDPQQGMVIDLDDTKYYETNPWSGFTTGEVSMSIYFDNYVSTSANIFITEIAGFDLTEYTFTDEVSPAVRIDYQGYEKDSIPMAFLNKPYKLFEGDSIDNLDGFVELKTKVYYNYYSNARIQCYIDNGSFIPKYLGEYTVVYTAKDFMGNETIECIDIPCIDSKQQVDIQLIEDKNTFTIGENARLNEYVVSNNNGTYFVDIVARLKNDNSVQYIIDNETLLFKPIEAGVYEILYTVSDYTHTVTVIDEITFIKTDIPVFGQCAEFPQYLIKNCSYSFDNAIAYDYSSGKKVEILADYYVVEDDGIPVKMENNSFRVSASKKVEIVYKANNGKGELSKSLAVIPVVDVNYAGNLEMQNYFQGEGFESSATDSAIIYTKLYDGNSQASLEFINKVLVNQFTFAVSIPKEYDSFETFDVYLKDELNENNVLKISFFVPEKNILSFIVNDYTKKVYSVSYTGDNININLYYQKDRNKLLINNNLSVDLDDLGVFNGFTGGFADFKIVFCEVTGNVACAVSYVCNQPFKKGLDLIKPTVYFSEPIKSLVNLNEEIVIKRAYAFDLLDPVASLSFKLMSFKGEFVVSTDGILLDGTQDPNRDYTVKLSNYGKYSLEYVAVDKTGNRCSIPNLITVQDFEPPTVTLTADYKTEAKVGDTIKIAQASVTDNLEGKITLNCYVIDRHGKMQELAPGDSFIAADSGIYTVYYYAKDAYLNVTMVFYTINVSK